MLIGNVCSKLCAEDLFVARFPPLDQSYSQNKPLVDPGLPSGYIEFAPHDAFWYDVHAVARASYFHDMRIEWSGQEATFGIEAVVAGAVGQRYGNWETQFFGEMFFNQPFNDNVLVDTAERRSYLANFQIDTLELSRMFLESRNGDLAFKLGKMATPFGRTYFPIVRNDFKDGPFIRTESILWRETGLLIQWDPDPFVFAAAITNGSEDRDTNSSKALISRVGVDTDTFAIGASIKWQDGIGSEGQKVYNNHIGMDFMVRKGRFTLSGEVIYDQYGFRRPGFDPNDITWPRSIYFRDQNRGLKQPIEGVGYYVNLDVNLENWKWMFNYGEFYPRAIGDPRHDTTTRRGIIKTIWHATPFLDMFTMVLIENWLPNAQAGRVRQGVAVLTGFQSGF